MKSVLDEAGTRLGISSTLPSRKRLGEILGYKNQYATFMQEGVEADLDIELAKFGLRTKVADVGSGWSLDSLRDVCDNADATFAVASLGHAYLRDVVKIREEGEAPYEHTVVVLSIDKTSNAAHVYDPMLQLAKRAGGEFPGHLEIPLPQFDFHWKDTDTPSWTLWFEKAKQTTFLRKWKR